MSWKQLTIRAKLYYGFKFFLHRNRRVLRSVQSLRAYLILGPLREHLVWYYQNCANNEPLKLDASPTLTEVNVEQILNRLENLGYSHVGILSRERVSRILDYSEVNKRVSHWNPHLIVNPSAASLTIPISSASHDVISALSRFCG